jgi:Hypothetical glycosyl hydrolase family 15/Fibronectin type III domain
MRAARQRIGGVRLVVGIALSLFGAATVTLTDAAATSGGFGATVAGRALLQWAPEEVGKMHAYTTSQAVEQARRWDLIVAHDVTFSASIAQMHAANPRLAVLAYVKGMYALPTQENTYPASWYSYDANGNKIRSLGWGTWLMNPASSGWVQSRVQKCIAVLASSGYDGCMLDSLGAGPLKAGWNTGLPINPSTGKVWTKSDWLAANTQLIQTVRDAVQPSLVVANTLLDPDPNLPPDLQLLAGGDGGIAEGFLRLSGQSVNAYLAPDLWKQQVDMLVTAGAQDKPVLTLTTLWTTATPAQVTSWHLYTLASFLLGTNGISYFYFTSSKADHPVLTTPWTVDIGDPVGGYSLQDGVYQRHFGNGLVLVNPGTSSVTVPISGSYTNARGSSVSGSVVMPPHAGQVLTVGFTSTPSAPINVVAKAASGSASVAFVAALSALGDPVRSYTVKAVDLTKPANGGQTQVVSQSPAVVSGLVNGDSYRFTVTARNIVGSGPASASSNTVVPRSG